MVNRELLDAVGEYIEANYVPEKNDIKLEREMKSIFDCITLFRERLKEKKRLSEDTDDFDEEEDVKEDYIINESVVKEFDPSSMRKTKMLKPMSGSVATSRKIDDLLHQVDESFSQRLLRMIDERGMTDSEVYTKAYVDRRHFSKIRKDAEYTPNKKTVLAFAIALELSIDEAKDLLGSAGFALSRSSKTDIVVAYCLQNKIYNMFDINEVLDAYGLPIF